MLLRSKPTSPLRTVLTRTWFISRGTPRPHRAVRRADPANRRSTPLPSRPLSAIRRQSLMARSCCDHLRCYFRRGELCLRIVPQRSRLWLVDTLPPSQRHSPLVSFVSESLPPGCERRPCCRGSES